MVTATASAPAYLQNSRACFAHMQEPGKTPVTCWNVQQVAAFFQSLSWAGPAAIALENHIDGEILLELSDADLHNDLGLTNLQIKKLRKDIKAQMPGASSTNVLQQVSRT